MTIQKRGRGRPRKPLFPDGTPSRRNSALTPLAQLVAAGQRQFDSRLMRRFAVGPHLPMDIVWAILAESDDPGSPESLRCIKAWEDARVEQSRLGQEAARERHRSAEARKRLVIDRNKDRFEAVKAGRKTANEVAKYIRRNWQRLGHFGSPASERTLHRWIAEYAGK